VSLHALSRKVYVRTGADCTSPGSSALMTGRKFVNAFGEPRKPVRLGHVVLPAQERATQAQEVGLYADDNDFIEFGMRFWRAVSEQSDHPFERGIEYEAECHIGNEVPATTATTADAARLPALVRGLLKRGQLAGGLQPDDLPRTIALRAPRRAEVEFLRARALGVGVEVLEPHGASMAQLLT
jgi:hypothetical protein